MLRCVRLKNFVHFKEEQTLHFKDGAYLFIGQNNSGKSSMFEAIRRCMSLDKNSSVFKVHEPKETGSVICVYDIPETAKGGNGKFVSATIKYPDYIKGSKSKCVKIAYKSNSGGHVVGIDLLEDTEQALTYSTLNLPSAQSQMVTELLKPFESTAASPNENENVFKIAEFEMKMKQLCDKSEVKKHDEISCDALLKENLDKNTVLTFALRNISPNEWTLDCSLGPDKTDEYNKEVQKQAKILSWYLQMQDEGRISDEEKSKEFEIFRILVDTPNFSFRREGGSIFAYYDEEEISLLRVPEGYYEAKKCSIMLAVKQFRTVCFEDPDRGMHPQMVTRLRDLVLPTIENKVVIMITHNPCFISAKTLSRSVIFARDKKSVFTTISGWKIINKLSQTRKRQGNEIEWNKGTTPDKKKKPESGKDERLITDSNFRSIFFARRVMVVEGASDLFFMEELKYIVLNKLDEDSFKQILGEKRRMDKMRWYLASLDFISLEGAGGAKRCNALCAAIMLERIFLLDNDVQTRRATDEKTKNDNFKKFLSALGLSGTDYSREDVTALEKEDIFIWKDHGFCNKSGTIEDAIISIDPEDRSKGSLKEVLEDNNCPLPFPILPQEPTSGAGNQYTMDPDDKKLFQNGNLTTKDILNCVKKILSVSAKQQETDINRLIRFLYRRADPDWEHNLKISM